MGRKIKYQNKTVKKHLYLQFIKVDDTWPIRIFMKRWLNAENEVPKWDSKKIISLFISEIHKGSRYVANTNFHATLVVWESHANNLFY